MRVSESKMNVTSALGGFTKSVVAPLIGTALLLSVGCSTGQRDPGDTSFDAIAGDLTPNKRGLVERPIDVDSHLAVTFNSEWRMLQDDLGRVFYTDHPSRLSPFPITSTSGQPR